MSTPITLVSVSGGKDSTATLLVAIKQYGAVESWQGVRAEESPSRAKLPEREDSGGGRMFDWIRATDEPKACASAYGLCE